MKNIILAIVLCLIVVFGWSYFAQYMGWIQPPDPQVVAQQEEMMRQHAAEVEKQKQQAEKEATEPVPDAPGVTRPAIPHRAKSEQGIIVEGLSNCLVKFSKCCTPVPGDEIIGFITRGYGVSVHRADCPNALRRKPEEAGRWIKVTWGSDVRESYLTSLEVYAKDRINLVLDVSAALSTTQTRVQALNASATADGFVIVKLSIYVSDSAKLSSLMRKINQISGVLKVDRPAG